MQGLVDGQRAARSGDRGLTEFSPFSNLVALALGRVDRVSTWRFLFFRSGAFHYL